jgi:aspartyl-tRNA(Asn)/glutamyl-tRNA(Gln) amidotransferase subunit A
MRPGAAPALPSVTSMTRSAAAAAVDRLARRGVEASLADAEAAADAAGRTVAAFRRLAGQLRGDIAAGWFAAWIEALRPSSTGAGSAAPRAARPAADPEAAVAAALARAEEVQRRFNAFIEITAEVARAGALRQTSLPPGRRGPLWGQPFAYKDAFVAPDRLPTAGVGCGHRWRGPESTTLAALERAGAIAIGATNLDPWCYIPLGLNDYFGHPRHPAGDELLVGGSSSGSAVAVATGVVDFALGTDTGGSVRVPAALCGVYGLKTTHGLIRDPGLVPLGAAQDTVGILGGSPAHVAEALAAIAPHRSAAGRDRDGKPAVVVERAMLEACDGPVAAAIDDIVRRLRALGASIGDAVLPELDGINAAAGILTGFEAGALHGERMAAHPEWYPDMVRQRILTGLLYEEQDYRDALTLRAAYLAEVTGGVLGGADAVVAPVVPMLAPRIADVSSPTLVPQFLRFNRPVNFLGFPSLAVPTGGRDGSPVGAQIIGRPFAEPELLRFAEKLAQA